jgi:hypothetical protein
MSIHPVLLPSPMIEGITVGKGLKVIETLGVYFHRGVQVPTQPIPHLVLDKCQVRE